MTYPITEIRKLLKASWLQEGNPVKIGYLLTDSRKLIYPDATLFIPLVTPSRDGHQFIGELYQRGVRAFLVSSPVDTRKCPEASFIQVPDTLVAFQALVAFHRRKFNIPVVGITGSNGKTVVKEWLYQLLEKDYNIVRSPKSYNSQTGVPLSVWQMSPENTLALFEAGISRPGEMTNLEKIIQPTAGIFTNIGDAHNEGFLNILQKIREKLVLFTGARVLIYCKDYPELHECVLQFHGLMRRKEQSDEKSLQLFTWSYKTEANLRVTAIHKPEDSAGSNMEEGHLFTRIEAQYKGRSLEIQIPFGDQGSIENAINCWCMMLWLDIPDEEIAVRMQQLSRVAMRLELKAAVGDCSLINDSYNSDLGSLSIALDFLAQQKQHARRTLILSDMLQSGRRDADLYEDVAGLLDQKGVNRLIGIGRNISREKDIFLKNKALNCQFFPTTEAFMEHFLFRGQNGNQVSFQDETILLKGARVFEFERISKLLEQKTHQTVLEINLNALTHNLKTYQALLKPGVKTMAMVKAFSYGSGSYEVANVLQFHQVDYLAVAYADEGIVLRQKGIALPIMVMNPEPGTFNAIIQWNLEPEIYSRGLLAAFEEELKQAGRTSYPVHIKLDTGMHRLGFSEQDLPVLASHLGKESLVRVVSVFSHLAASGEKTFEAFTREQAARFERMSALLTGSLSYPVIRHLANSAAIGRYPEFQYDMVRLGIGLYGIDETAVLQDSLEVVSALKTTVSQLRKVPPGETVGYSRAGKVETEKVIATVSVGYADGYLRALGNGKGKMYLHGKAAPVIGNVCMDMLMLDVTDIPETREGDSVVVFGEMPSIIQVAEWAETIPYEIMTGISGRVKRVYIQE